MRDLKVTNKIIELKSYIPIELFYGLIEAKTIWLYSINVSLVLVESREAIKGEDIKLGGKVVWDNEVIGMKRPLRILLNVLDYKSIELLAIFLHECGHVKDKDNEDILLQSLPSEISAWKHAIVDFIEINSSESQRLIFFEIIRQSLKSYKVSVDDIEKLLN